MSKLIKCKTCQAEIANSTKACPSCGAKNKKPIYKKWWAWAIAVVVIFSVASQGGGDATPVNSKSQEQSATASKEASPANSDAPTAQSSEPPPKEEKSPIVVTIETLTRDLKENALNASNTYKGQYVEVTGRLSNIDSSGKYISISDPSSDFSFDSIICYIKKEHTEAVSKLKTDQEVTVVGTVKSVGEVVGYSINVDYIKE